MNLYVATGSALLAALLSASFARAAYVTSMRAGEGAVAAARVTRKTLGIQLGWLGVTGAAAAAGMYTNFNEVPPKLPLTLLASIVFLVAFSRSNRYSLVLKFAPLAWPVGVQSMRVFIELGLWQLHRDQLLPKHLTFDGYNFDILVGLSAPIVALGLAQGWVSKRAAIVWNIAGMGFLFAIVFMAITSAPGPQHLNWPGVPNGILALFPTVWLPTFFVPVALLGHLTSLGQLIPLQARLPNSSKRPLKLRLGN
jgi:hypothetical protein